MGSCLLLGGQAAMSTTRRARYHLQRRYGRDVGVHSPDCAAGGFSPRYGEGQSPFDLPMWSAPATAPGRRQNL